MKLVIVGGSAGGTSVATRVRRANESASITLFERTAHIASAYCGLPYHVGGVIAQRETLLPVNPAELARRHCLDIRTRHEVLAINRPAQTVTVRDLADGRIFEEPYDKLVLATGAEAHLPALPGIDLPGVFGLRNLPDLDRIMDWMKTRPVRHATVVGGGFVGLELAENLVRRGYTVSLIEAGPRLMPALDPEFSRLALEHTRAHGVDVRLGDTLASIEPRARLHAALAHGETLDTDLVLLTPGVRPANALARDAGVALGGRGGILVDEQMRSSDATIYAVGDAIEAPCAVTGEAVWVPLAVPLNQQVRILASALAGEPASYRGALGTFVCRLFDLTVAATGLTEQRLRALSRPFEQVLIPGTSHVGFYPDAQTLYLKLLFDPRDGKLLGAQAAGRAGVDKRIDVLATALTAGMTVYDLEAIELAYAPPYGAPRDVVNLAGAVATSLLREKVRGVAPAALPAASREMFVLDVRTREEYEFGAIPGAVHIPADAVRERLRELPRDKPIVVSCQIGAKAHSVTRLLSQRGYEARNLIGGYAAWRLFHGERIAPVLPHRRAEQEETHTASAAAEELDTRGLSCPGPIMHVRRHMDKAAAGEVVRIRASASSFPMDFRMWCKKTGHQILEESGRPGDYMVVCRKH